MERNEPERADEAMGAIDAIGSGAGTLERAWAMLRSKGIH